MISKKSISIFVTTFLIIGFFFLALPEKGYSGLGTIGGCCIDNEACVGCDSGCSTSESFCEIQGGTSFKVGMACVSGPSIECGGVQGSPGCCVIGPGDCVDDQFFESCFGGRSGEVWLIGESCSEVPECEVNVVSAVPTISEWGLIAIAAVLGIVGFIVIRRRKVTA